MLPGIGEYKYVHISTLKSLHPTAPLFQVGAPTVGGGGGDVVRGWVWEEFRPRYRIEAVWNTQKRHQEQVVALTLRKKKNRLTNDSLS
jgi:hypothetical protein